MNSRTLCASILLISPFISTAGPLTSANFSISAGGGAVATITGDQTATGADVSIEDVNHVTTNFEMTDITVAYSLTGGVSVALTASKALSGGEMTVHTGTNASAETVRSTPSTTVGLKISSDISSSVSVGLSATKAMDPTNQLGGGTEIVDAPIFGSVSVTAKTPLTPHTEVYSTISAGVANQKGGSGTLYPNDTTSTAYGFSAGLIFTPGAAGGCETDFEDEYQFTLERCEAKGDGGLDEARQKSVPREKICCTEEELVEAGWPDAGIQLKRAAIF
jgi:hypothetical protein